MSKTLNINCAQHKDALSGTVFIYASEGPVLTGRALNIWNTLGMDFERAAKVAAFSGKKGQVLDVVTSAEKGIARLIVLGAGKSGDDAASTEIGLRDRGGSLMGKATAFKVETATVVLDDIEPLHVADIAAGARLRHYKFDKYHTKKSGDDDTGGADVVTLIFQVDDKAATENAVANRGATASGTLLARDLVNEPTNLLGPEEFADVARGLSKLGVEVEVLGVAEMEKLGMGALLAVGRGSVRPPRLAVMQWNGGKKDDAPLAFVGKGVVFDTGGISLKPGASMEDMKGDMGGAAAVTGLMHALATRKAPVNAVGVIGLAENMPDGDAYRPGDILKSMSGQTIEVINTDAEGRLVLADALWYTQGRFKPKFMFDLATLTGAIVVGLGQEHAGLFSNNDEISEKLFAAGTKSGEKVWRLPLNAAYDKMIDSRFADMKNIGGRQAGSITAAQFLQRFVNDTPWAHIDIAGPAFGSPTSETNTSWASGFGVALLDRLVRDNFEPS